MPARRAADAGRRKSARRSAGQFYRSVVGTAEELIDAAGVEGIDQEVALLRVKLRDQLKERPQDYALMLKGLELLVRAVSSRYRMSPKRTDDLAQHLAATVRSLGEQFYPERFADV